MTVLASLRGRHVNDLARAVLDDNEATLSQGRTLLRVGGGGTGIGAIEFNFVLLNKDMSVRICSILSADDDAWKKKGGSGGGGESGHRARPYTVGGAGKGTWKKVGYTLARRPW